MVMEGLRRPGKMLKDFEHRGDGLTFHCNMVSLALVLKLDPRAEEKS